MIQAPQSPPLTGLQAAPKRGLQVGGSLTRLGMPLFWLLLSCFILAPCACFLLLAVSPGCSARAASGSR